MSAEDIDLQALPTSTKEGLMSFTVIQNMIGTSFKFTRGLNSSSMTPLEKLEIDLKKENNEPSIEILWETLRHYWEIIVPFLVALLLVCFLISKKMVESRIKARFHGIKIW